MKKIITLILYSLLTTMALRADVIFKESFNYPDGFSTINSTNVVGGLMATNWLLHSGNLDSYINGKRLEVVSTSAYLGVTATRSGDVHRLLSLTNNSVYTNAHQVLYASFVVNFTNLPTAAGAYFAHFYVDSFTFPCRLWARTNGTVLPRTYRLGIQMGSASVPNQIYPVDLALNTDYQVVIEYDPVGLDAATVWINPITPSGASDFSIITSDAYVPGTSIVNSFAFRQASGFGGYLTVSNLVLATTFDEAATNCLSTNAVAPKIVYQPITVQSNFPTANLSISAVANGQGLGNMTYQWQVASATNGAGQLISPTNVIDGGDITGSATSILSFSSTVTNDSGYYALVATTPYGLSVTSSVSKFAIVDGPYPPVITVQPANVTGYAGYSAYLTVTAASPPSGGTVKFTWYSNNVVVSSTDNNSGAQTDSTSPYSSTYGWASALTNYSATYKVAISNSNPGGVVSSNAVLSVINPPAVSIAFLRQLVDPNNNYQATNSTIAFSATGVITTHTNLTTGNTASYYLQDATAGINIFATFGSTFRPAQGDIVTFVGVMSSFSSGLELYADPGAGDPSSSVPYTTYTNSGPGTLPAPMLIPFSITNSGYANMNTNIAGRLVRLSDVFFGTNAGTMITNGFFTVTNGSGDSFRLWFSIQDTNTLGNTFPAYAYSVTGVMFGSMNPSIPQNGTPNPNFAVAVTSFSDINTNVGVSPAISEICTGNSVTLTATHSDPGPVTYLWSPGGQTTPTITVTPPASTTNFYTVTVTDTGTSTVWGSAVATVIVYTNIVSQTIRAPASICLNNSATISLVSSVPGTTYLLTTNSTLGVGTVFATVNGTGTNVNFASQTPIVPTTYWVLATNRGGCSAVTIGSTNITINALPVAQTIVAPASVCSNSPATIGLASSVSGTTYLLQTNASLGLGIVANGSGSGPAVNFASQTLKVTTTYWVYATNTSGCSLFIGTATIPVNALPTTSAITGPTSVSAGQSGVTYSVTLTSGSTYGWTVPAGASFTGGTGNSINVTFGSTSGNVSVTETNNSGCTGTLVSKSVTVVPLSPVTIAGISGTSINYTGGSGSKFILLSSGDLTVLPGVWARLLTNTTTPGSFTIPVVGSSNQLFYRIKSE
jgi:hypothetical protein